MKVFDVFDSEKTKLDTILAEHNMVCEFHANTYPATLTIAPDASPSAQMELFSAAEDGAASQDARLTFIFPVGEIGMKIVGRMALTDALMNKIKGAAKKIHKAYLEGFFAERMTKAVAAPPAIADDDVEDVTEVADAIFDDFFEDYIEDDSNVIS